MRKIAAALILLFVSSPWLAAQSKDERMAWWREARFGMFIHWGLYAVPAGVWKGRETRGIGEWIMHHLQIPVQDYEPLRDKFNPVKFDADQWARIAKAAGMKYVVITSKHHDGFALFDSQHSDYDIMSTPFKRDIMKELADACRKHGLKMCWYHSIMDWHHPDYLPRRKWEKRSAEGADFERYVRYMKAQVKELLTRYGDIGIMWFDGQWEGTWTKERGRDLLKFVRDLAPKTIVNNRVGKTHEDGDYGTPEQYIPATGLPGRDWETCMTMNRTWGFKKNDHDWKSSTVLIRNLIDIVSKGGNYLLNVGPTALGEIPGPSVERLAAMGKWMTANGESIYGTTASPFRRLKWGRCTRRDGDGSTVLYLHVFDWPKDGKLLLPGLKSEVKSARLLAAKPRPMSFTRIDDGVLLATSGEAVHPAATVIALEIEGAVVVDIRLPREANGVVELPATEADIHGRAARLEHKHPKGNVGFWTRWRDWVVWEFEVARPGTFDVELNVACSADNAGTRFVVKVGKQKLEGAVPDTGGWDKFKPVDVGRLKLAGGKLALEVRAKSKPKLAVMNLASVRLTRVRDR